jgi:hypothetical protein
MWSVNGKHSNYHLSLPYLDLRTHGFGYWSDCRFPELFVLELFALGTYCLKALAHETDGQGTIRKTPSPAPLNEVSGKRKTQ